MTECLKICTFNVNGLRDKVKRKAIFQIIRTRKIDICLLQETHSTHPTHLLWKNEWGGEIYFGHGGSNSCGVAILMRRGLTLKKTHEIIDPNGRYLIVRVEINGLSLETYIYTNTR